MKIKYILIRDFFNICLGTWLSLVLLEIFNPGMVQRHINLEYWFYFLIITFIFYRLVRKY
ncbi:hypothetical protein C0580_00475 [Candidatus Parcubacteria bacterium]|nr:MAG: hypothetical protein C0580_00475 [Candidatus Parcubacteria bacterium]